MNTPAPPIVELLDERPDTLGLRTTLASPSGRSGCPCGWEGYAMTGRSGVDAAHARKHLQWARGVPLPARIAFWDDSLLVVHQDSQAVFVTFAYDVGRFFQREGGYDFAPLRRRVTDWCYDGEPVAYLAIWQGRAIGLAVLDTRPRWGYCVTDGEGRIQLDVETPLRSVGAVWVAHDYRRHGVGRRLIQAAAEAEGLTPQTLGWALPFSEAGARLAESFAPRAQLRVTG
jgi:GNAT superfamily N-acetyltransferase